VHEIKLGDSDTGLVYLIADDTSSKNIQLNKIITVKINNEQLVVNGKATSLANFAKTLNKITKNWTKDELANCRFDVIVQNSDDEFIEKIEREYQKTKLFQANPNNKLVPPPPPLPEVIVVEEIEDDEVQIVEVKIANKAIEETNNAIEVIEIKRAPNTKISKVIEIKVAPKVLIIEDIKVDENVPPPPPIAAKVAVKLIKSVDAVIAETPPPPPPPVVDFKELAAKGATFYLEGKEITFKKAMKALDKNRALKVEIVESNMQKPTVKLWKN
jgi:hypothetical protein